MLQTTCKLLEIGQNSEEATLALTVKTLFTVLFSNVTFTGVFEPKMFVDPFAETSMSTAWSVKLVKTFTAATSAWKSKFKRSAFGWETWFVWLKFTGLKGVNIIALTITAESAMAIKIMTGMKNGFLLIGLLTYGVDAGAGVSTGVPQW
jgi:hypothetical protein